MKSVTSHTCLFIPLARTQVSYIQGFSWFFRRHVFLYAMVAMMLLTVLYLCIWPNDKRALEEEDDGF